ncbi:hypothetical protein ABH945_007270 [Paraburkholderia sp. GAS333]
MRRSALGRDGTDSALYFGPPSPLIQVLLLRREGSLHFMAVESGQNASSISALTSPSHRTTFGTFVIGIAARPHDFKARRHGDPDKSDIDQTGSSLPIRCRRYRSRSPLAASISTLAALRRSALGCPDHKAFCAFMLAQALEKSVNCQTTVNGIAMLLPLAAAAGRSIHPGAAGQLQSPLLTRAIAS